MWVKPHTELTLLSQSVNRSLYTKVDTSIQSIQSHDINIT